MCKPSRIQGINYKMISVVIRTIGRSTLNNAVSSALKEFGKVIVVADCVDLQDKVDDPHVTYLRTGMKFDKYGSAALNMGACAVTTPYFCLLDDDDEFEEGAGEFMNSFIKDNPEYDIVIPGLKYNNGLKLCGSPGLQYGNVAVPTFKTKWALKVPITPLHLEKSKVPPNAIDLAHVIMCSAEGAKVGWYEKYVYLVRPKLAGTNGRGV
jgi:glycosyltransferase involved in cell wall biosynthesis